VKLHLLRKGYKRRKTIPQVFVKKDLLGQMKTTKYFSSIMVSLRAVEQVIMQILEEEKMMNMINLNSKTLGLLKDEIMASSEEIQQSEKQVSIDGIICKTSLRSQTILIGLMLAQNEKTPKIYSCCGFFKKKDEENNGRKTDHFDSIKLRLQHFENEDTKIEKKDEEENLENLESIHQNSKDSKDEEEVYPKNLESLHYSQSDHYLYCNNKYKKRRRKMEEAQRSVNYRSPRKNYLLEKLMRKFLEKGKNRENKKQETLF